MNGGTHEPSNTCECSQCSELSNLTSLALERPAVPVWKLRVGWARRSSPKLLAASSPTESSLAASDLTSPTTSSLSRSNTLDLRSKAWNASADFSEPMATIGRPETEGEGLPGKADPCAVRLRKAKVARIHRSDHWRARIPYECHPVANSENKLQ